MSEVNSSSGTVVPEPTATPMGEATANPANNATEDTSVPGLQRITGEELMAWANALRMDAYIDGLREGSEHGYQLAHREFCETCRPAHDTAETDAPAIADEQDTKLELSVFQRTVSALSTAIDAATVASVVVLGAGVTAATISMCAEEFRGGNGSKTRGVLSTFGGKLLDNLYPLKSSA